MQDRLVGFLHRGTVPGPDREGERAQRGKRPAVAAEEAEDRGLPGPGDFRGPQQVRTPAARREEDQAIAPPQEGLGGAGEDFGEAEVIPDAGEGGRVGAEADRRERRPIRAVAAGKLLGEVERFRRRSAVPGREDRAALGERGADEGTGPSQRFRLLPEGRERGGGAVEASGNEPEEFTGRLGQGHAKIVRPTDPATREAGRVRIPRGRPANGLPMVHFRAELARRQIESREVSRWVLVAPDQLTLEVGPLAADPNAGVLLVESDEWLARRPYHRQRLAWILLSMRAFALEAAAEGRCVRYESTREPIAAAVGRFARRNGPLLLMRPAERELRAELAPLVEAGRIELVPHAGWLTTEDDFRASLPRRGGSFRMDAFYRTVRKRTRILVEGGKPVGGAWSFDAENRLPWPGTPEAPEPPRCASDPLREELAAEIAERFPRHPGRLDLGAIAATRDEVDRLWAWARERCLPHFGPFEDAMSVRSRGLFHTRISPAMNLLRLLPKRVVDDALALDLPLPSREGFLRQILGWREFVRHVHEATDGFRSLDGRAVPVAPRPGRAGLAAAEGAGPLDPPNGIDGGACPDLLGADLPLPAAYWGDWWPDGAKPSGLACLDRVVADVWEEGWSHHITRLMVLANLATLLGVRPREITDWFWIAYADAWDWVVEPNVLGMGTFAAGETMTTKPYVSGSGYLDRMGDYCAGCAFDPKRDCPITPLYWEFLRRHEGQLARNPRMGVVLAAMRKRGPERQERDRATFLHVREVLVRGERLRPPQATLLDPATL